MEISECLQHARKMKESMNGKDLETMNRLIHHTKQTKEIADHWIGIEENGTEEDAGDFYNIVHEILMKDEV